MAEPVYIDPSVPRGKAILHAALPAAAFALGGSFAGYSTGIIGLAMLASVIGGPSLSLIGKLYRIALKPILPKNAAKPEALAPHRFAELVGAIFLIAASSAYLLGSSTLGGVLTLIVVALAALNAGTGICVGCQVYLLARRLAGPRTEF